MDYEYILTTIEAEINQFSGDKWFYLHLKPVRTEAKAYFKSICCNKALRLLKAYNEIAEAQAEDF